MPHNERTIKNTPLAHLVMIILLIIFCISCINRATEEDKRRITIIKEKYGDYIYISIEEEIYVKLKDLSSKNGGIPIEMAIEIYKVFFFLTLDRESLRATEYTYLNVYKSNGRFDYQLYYDNRNKQFGKSFTEHH
ncbi:MAG: hypothetical protein JW927_18450 [Deltaproteobacteria bacterium]|nr:hypothetical protein [Deltaproteobacteria bacterium]